MRKIAIRILQKRLKSDSGSGLGSSSGDFRRQQRDFRLEWRPGLVLSWCYHSLTCGCKMHGTHVQNLSNKPAAIEEQKG
eukprot:3697092-Amphidinium_carterae.3